MKKVILFDLDGTLLPMDQDVFVQKYFGALAQWMAPYGYDPQKLVKAVWMGTEAMVRNDGSMTNEERFWKSFEPMFDLSVEENIPHFNEFYEKGFIVAKDATSCNPQMKELIASLKEKGYRIALATNPLFPAIATHQRVAWAGLNVDDFELITTYEQSRTCKPNPNYYIEVAERLGVDPKDCIMVGNDVSEDSVAMSVGMDFFLLTDCLLNKNELPIDHLNKGNVDDLINWLSKGEN